MPQELLLNNSRYLLIYHLVNNLVRLSNPHIKYPQKN